MLIFGGSGFPGIQLRLACSGRWLMGKLAILHAERGLCVEGRKGRKALTAARPLTCPLRQHSVCWSLAGCLGRLQMRLGVSNS